jgi:hypothetical protein
MGSNEGSAKLAVMPRAIQRMGYVFAIAVAIVGCASTSDAGRRAVKQEVALEVERVCALEQPARDVEMKKIKAESGLEIYCAVP